MPDLLATGSHWLETMRARHLTRDVVYRRGAEQVTLPATIGRTVFEQEYSSGVIEKLESRDYLITAADLVLGAVPVLPERGDRIDETVGDKTFTYEVMAPGQEPAWRYSDPYRETFRIHTKQVGRTV